MELNETPFALSAEESQKLYSKITWRLIPLLFVCYIIAYIDRINVGFAKLQLREVLGVDEAIFGSVYGLGAGLFFIGYFLFEIPSNLILARVGARIWIARIMIIWGFVAASMMVIHSTTMFYVMRFILGVAEAGFYPGILLYLTYWYPARERAKVIAMFATGAVIAGILGSPVSGAILGMEGYAGLAGWQWLFLLEGIPAVVLGVVVLLVLPNGPSKARWLSTEEKNEVQFRLDEEIATRKDHVHLRLSKALKSKWVWLLCLVYFLLNVGGYGYELWMPSIINELKGLSFTSFGIGLVNAFPYLLAGISMFLVGRNSDRTGDRRWHMAVSAAISAIGFFLSAYFQNPFLALASLTIAFIGLKSTVGPFWALATSFLTGTAAAGGIAFINSVGNLGGFVGPYLVGVFKDRTGNNQLALWILGGALLLMGILILFVRDEAVPKKNRLNIFAE